MTTNFDTEKTIKGVRALRTMHTLQMKTTHCLQFVVTRSFLNLLSEIQEAFSSAGAVGGATDADDTSSGGSNNETTASENDLLDKEEERFLEHMEMNKSSGAAVVAKIDAKLEKEFEEYDENDEENQSFNFMLKNELGFDVLIEPKSGFRVCFLFVFIIVFY